MLYWDRIGTSPNQGAFHATDRNFRRRCCGYGSRAGGGTGGGSAARITLLDRNPRCGKKLLATGNGRCNLDNTGIAPECYFTADPKALAPLLAAVERSAPLEWFRALGLYTRTDEAGRVYPYSNQAADVLALLEGQMARLGVEVPDPAAP